MAAEDSYMAAAVQNKPVEGPGQQMGDEDKHAEMGDVGVLSLDEDVGGVIQLLSAERKEFQIERKFSLISTLVKTTLESGTI
jgi:hypothetical protein